MSETAAAPIGLFDRAIRRIATVWRDMASTVPDDDQSILAQMRACLHARGGEVSARNRAAKLAQTYLGLDDKTTMINRGRCSPADVLQFALEKKLALQPIHGWSGVSSEPTYFCMVSKFSGVRLHGVHSDTLPYPSLISVPPLDVLTNLATSRPLLQDLLVISSSLH
ncbi:MAG: hypothetical protein EOO40_11475 [Deltaproteobacteria bacterium]|nr:MAG: hypothetical protein EOO40_11475 [Deltaproteobacteria bacterium]